MENEPKNVIVIPKYWMEIGHKYEYEANFAELKLAEQLVQYIDIRIISIA